MTEGSFHRRRSSAVWLAGAALALAVGGGAWLWYDGSLPGTTTPAQAQTAAPPPPPVTVSHPLRRDLVEWDEFTGQFAAGGLRRDPRAGHRLPATEIHFQDGQIVKKGDLLFVIDPRPYEAALAPRKAQLAQAKAQARPGQLSSWRAAELRQTRFEPASTYDQRVAGSRASPTAGVEVAKAAVRDGRAQSGFTRITAPSPGRISQREVSIGNLITGGTGSAPTLLTTIVSLDPIYFIFDMSEARLPRLSARRRRAASCPRPATARPIVHAHLVDEDGLAARRAR